MKSPIIVILALVMATIVHAQHFRFTEEPRDCRVDNFAGCEKRPNITELCVLVGEEGQASWVCRPGAEVQRWFTDAAYPKSCRQRLVQAVQRLQRYLPNYSNVRTLEARPEDSEDPEMRLQAQLDRVIAEKAFAGEIRTLLKECP